MAESLTLQGISGYSTVPPKVMICGSRGWDHADTLLQALWPERFDPGTTFLIGGARGADTMAEKIVLAAGFAVQVIRPDWSLGRDAGFARNIALLDLGPSLVIAFWKGRSGGTRHVIGEAMKREIPTEIHWRP